MLLIWMLCPLLAVIHTRRLPGYIRPESYRCWTEIHSLICACEPVTGEERSQTSQMKLQRFFVCCVRELMGVNWHWRVSGWCDVSSVPSNQLSKDA